MKSAFFLIFLPVLALSDPKANCATNGAPNMAGYWEESGGAVWKSTQSGNVFMWIQDKTRKIAKGIIVAKYPDSDPDPAEWQVFITFEHTLSKINMPLNFNANFSQLTSKNDVFKRVAKPASIRVSLISCEIISFK